MSERKVSSIDQPSTRTSEGSGAALRKEGNCTCVMGDKPYNTGSNAIDAGRPTTNPAQGKTTGLREMAQGFTPGSGKSPSRLDD